MGTRCELKYNNPDISAAGLLHRLVEKVTLPQLLTGRGSLNTNAEHFDSLWPLIFYGLAVLAVVIAMLGGSYMLGHKGRDWGEPFESGIVPAGTSQIHYNVPFYLIAIFFVIFDLEAVFLFAWAIAFREVGWAGYIEILVFIGILIAALYYLWRIGALDWRTPRQKRQEDRVRRT